MRKHEAQLHNVIIKKSSFQVRSKHRKYRIVERFDDGSIRYRTFVVMKRVISQCPWRTDSQHHENILGCSVITTNNNDHNFLIGRAGSTRVAENGSLHSLGVDFFGDHYFSFYIREWSERFAVSDRWYFIWRVFRFSSVVFYPRPKHPFCF